MKVKILDSMEGRQRLEQASDSPYVTNRELMVYRRVDFPGLSGSTAQI